MRLTFLAAPGLPISFGLRDLKPILVKPDEEGDNTYLLTDGTSYFMFEEIEGRMWKFKDNSLTLGMVVDKVSKERYDGRDLVEHIYPMTRR